MTYTNELRKLLAAATPTPWAVSHGDESWEVVQTKPDGTTDFGARRTAFDDGSAGGEYGPSCNTSTRDLIVAAVNALPSLLDELDGRRAEGVQCEIALAETEHELNQARAEVERLREDANMTAMDLVDERDDARADLREAVELLRVFGFCTEADPDHELLLVERRQKLLDRHP